MSGTYYQISEIEMVEFLEPKGFSQTDVPGALEMVFDFEHPKAPGRGIRVYTSIARGRAREKGKDAIRCMYWSFEHDRPWGFSKRIHRIETWKKNLTNRLRIMSLALTKFDVIGCPECGAPMAERYGMHGKFYGCISYPECKGTRRAAGMKRAVDETEAVAKKYLRERNLLL